MTTSSKINPKGRCMHTLTPDLGVDGAAKFMDCLRSGFQAEEVVRAPGPGGKLMHAHARIGDADLSFHDFFPELGMGPVTQSNSSLTLHLYVPDADAVFAQAQAAGCKVTLPLNDMFWGDRYGQVRDPFGFTWAIATHKEDPTPEQIKERMAKMFSAGAPKQ